MASIALGRRVHRLRKEASLTQAALAESVGVSRTYISMIERGHKLGSVVVLRRIAARVGISLDALVDGVVA